LCILKLGFCGICVGIIRNFVCFVAAVDLVILWVLFGGLAGGLLVLVICCDFDSGVGLMWHNLVWFLFAVLQNFGLGLGSQFALGLFAWCVILWFSAFLACITWWICCGYLLGL